MKIIHVTTKKELDALYNQSALTWEGLSSDEANLDAVKDWLNEHRAIIEGTEPTFHMITGELMNTQYELSGTNAYDDDLTLIAVTDINQMAIVLPRFEVGGRWFDDIVDNNARREE